ncbi:MAG: HPr family phosphocarrier protein [Desulfuromusa sp.]|nr:HPr family phosphocarrier protein [Desulfuromusa sp.]
MSVEINVELTIINKLGLHARAAAKLASTAGKYGCAIKTGPTLDKLVDAKSVMSLMLLAASQGTILHFYFDGSDAEKAHRDIEQLLANRFDEEQ